jgi:hypothetical protein
MLPYGSPLCRIHQRMWIIDLSEQAIGRTWTSEDHTALVHALQEIDRLPGTSAQLEAGELRRAETDPRRGLRGVILSVASTSFPLGARMFRAISIKSAEYCPVR